MGWIECKAAAFWADTNITMGPCRRREAPNLTSAPSATTNDTAHAASFEANCVFVVSQWQALLGREATGHQSFRGPVSWCGNHEELMTRVLLG